MKKLSEKEIETYMDDNINYSYDPESYNYFENYCNACDNFETDKCPFRYKVKLNTRWKEKPYQCEKFND